MRGSDWTGYRRLENGEKIQAGDEAWTWIDPECTEIGWYTIKHDTSMTYDKSQMVTMRRKVKEAEGERGGRWKNEKDKSITKSNIRNSSVFYEKFNVLDRTKSKMGIKTTQMAF